MYDRENFFIVHLVLTQLKEGACFRSEFDAELRPVEEPRRLVLGPGGTGLDFRVFFLDHHFVNVDKQVLRHHRLSRRLLILSLLDNFAFQYEVIV